MQKRQLFGTLSALPYCLRLSWQSSRKYTAVRLLGKIILPVADILGAYILKYVLDLLSGAWTVPEPSRTLTGLLLLAAVLPLTAAIFRRLVSYAEGLHNNILEQYVQQDLMDKALSADLELFDNPKFYDKFAPVRRDSYALTYQIWNVLDCVSASIGFLGTLLVLSSSSPLYGLLMVAAAHWSTGNIPRYCMRSPSPRRETSGRRTTCSGSPPPGNTPRVSGSMGSAPC